MINISKDTLERAADEFREGYIDLDGESGLKFRKLTEGHLTHFLLLYSKWLNGRAGRDDEHFSNYLIRRCLTDIVGFRDETGRVLELVMENDLASHVMWGEKRIDIISLFIKIDREFLQSVFGLMYTRVVLGEIQKKTSLSPPDSSKAEISLEPQSGLHQEKFSQDGGPSSMMEPRSEKIESNVMV